ncbi:tripartite tricarboxylate transporter substrate binding protein [Bordetella sp. BOR01]|uniref:Bug family tripartite tricarboxylate transporter substrate binding protein n=1 Tax=Bordetella sp. BOR01 TaxID=2854779 RepID=UPI001C46AD80|nr:tripartite tricarboxylate transporter substrate binding protein [Bordetella sp. BOR01]MBV7481712.1 tripartite tricarboxylate transporter substrate binding protein [Bordetella sp. BOR01]
MSLLAPIAAHADAAGRYPDRAINLIVPIGAGGVADTSARILAQRLGDHLKVPVVVQNKPGAAQAIGAELVARAKPDGYTLLFSTSGFVAAPMLIKGFKPDPVEDFDPISLIASSNNVLVGANAIPGGRLKGLVELAKAKPGQVFYGSPSGATTLVFEYLNQVTGAKLEPILYQSTPAAWADIIGGRVHATMEGPKLAQGQVQAGKAQVLAVFGHKRAPEFPDVPTVAEQGYPGFGIESWQGLWAPKGTPAEVVRTLEQAVVAVMATPQMKQEMRAAGLDAVGSTAAEFGKELHDNAALWRKVATEAGIEPQ